MSTEYSAAGTPEQTEDRKSNGSQSSGSPLSPVSLLLQKSGQNYCNVRIAKIVAAKYAAKNPDLPALEQTAVKSFFMCLILLGYVI